MFNLEDKDKQAEFFNDLPELSKKPKQRKSSLGHAALSLSYENLIVFAIGLIMLLIVCYSLGVERGKYLVRIKTEDIEEINQEQAQKAPTTKPSEPQEKRVRVELATAEPALKLFPYIQVASFRTDKYAKKEAEQLENKGYKTYIDTWGKYKVVCVGKYEDYTKAREAFQNLRKDYADCILHKK